jgi:uncharacterized protein (DUF1778 family)
VTDFAIATLVIQAEEALADQRVFTVAADKWNEIERMAKSSEGLSGLADLYSKPSVLIK